MLLLLVPPAHLFLIFVMPRQGPIRHDNDDGDDYDDIWDSRKRGVQQLHFTIFVIHQDNIFVSKLG